MHAVWYGMVGMVVDLRSFPGYHIYMSSLTEPDRSVTIICSRNFTGLLKKGSYLYCQFVVLGAHSNIMEKRGKLCAL